MQRMAHQVATSQERLAQASSLLLQAQLQSDFFAQHLLVLVLLRASRQAAALGNSAPAVALLRGLHGMWSRMEVGPPQTLSLHASMSKLGTEPQLPVIPGLAHLSNFAEGHLSWQVAELSCGQGCLHIVWRLDPAALCSPVKAEPAEQHPSSGWRSPASQHLRW